MPIQFLCLLFLHWWKTKTKDLSGLFFLYCSEKKTHQQILFITCENASHPWVIVNQFHAWTGNRVNRNRRKKISNENGIKLFHAKSLEKLIGSNDKKYKENCRGFFSHYIPEIIAIFHLLHSQKKNQNRQYLLQQQAHTLWSKWGKKVPFRETSHRAVHYLPKKIFIIFWKNFLMEEGKKSQKC